MNAPTTFSFRNVHQGSELNMSIHSPTGLKQDIYSEHITRSLKRDEFHCCFLRPSMTASIQRGRNGQYFANGIKARNFNE